MRKIAYIYIVIILILSIAVISLLIIQRRVEFQNLKRGDSTTPQEKNDTNGKEGKIIIKTQNGDVDINDVYSVSEEIISGNATVKTTPEYQIVYSGERQNFIISILSSDLQNTRSKAEQEFLKILGIGEEKACLLDVTLGVSKDANPNAAGRNYGLSFCPNGKPFPSE